MPKVIGSISSGIKLTIPSRGEKNWDELIENSCFVPLSTHNHEGGGKGDKLNTDALNDEAVTTAKIANANVTEAKLDSAVQTKLAQIATNTSDIATNAFEISSLADQHAILQSQITNVEGWNLDDLNDVSSTTPTSGQALAWSGSQWEPTTISGGSGSSNVHYLTSSSQLTVGFESSVEEGDVIVISGTDSYVFNSSYKNVTFLGAGDAIGTQYITFKGTMHACVVRGHKLRLTWQTANVAHSFNDIICRDFYINNKLDLRNSRFKAENVVFNEGIYLLDSNASVVNVTTQGTPTGTDALITVQHTSSISIHQLIQNSASYSFQNYGELKIFDHDFTNSGLILTNGSNGTLTKTSGTTLFLLNGNIIVNA
jgi:hypothetical protein